MARNGQNGRDLIVVIPVYNEEDSIDHVIQEWFGPLEALNVDYRFLIINDGSTDGTKAKLAQLKHQFQVIDVIDKTNSGHGQSCIGGYKEAISRQARWVFQIDSDGQCDPQYFRTCWQFRQAFPVVFGQRIHRDDGFLRSLISMFNRLAVWLATGVTIPDSNVPYRLMRRDVLETAVNQFPPDFYLANILVAIILKKGLEQKMKHVPIGFRQRHGGEASVKWGKFISLGWEMFHSLRGQRHFVRQKSREIEAIASMPQSKKGVVKEVSP